MELNVFAPAIEARGVSVPKVDQVGTFGLPFLHEGKEYCAWMLMQRVPGQALARFPFSKIDWTDAQQREELKGRANEVIDVAALMHVDARQHAQEKGIGRDDVKRHILDFACGGIPSNIPAAGKALALALGEDIAKLAATGDLGITFVHGDFHPGNILVTPKGRYGVVDYDESPGISSAVIDLQRTCALYPEDGPALVARYNRATGRQISEGLVAAVGMAKTAAQLASVLERTDKGRQSEGGVIYERLSRLAKIMKRTLGSPVYSKIRQGDLLPASPRGPGRPGKTIQGTVPRL